MSVSPPAASASASVVQIFVTSISESWRQPWQRRAPVESTGSGFVVCAARRLLCTCAHVVARSETLQVRADGCFSKFEARVLALAHDVDLALLTVDDAAFWQPAGALPPLRALKLGEAPRLTQEVAALGYPVGGDTLSVTSGVVSRVDWSAYSHSASSTLIATVDAAINSGNSGGPVLDADDAVVGVAFQSYSTSTEAENIGYVVPTPILLRVIEDFGAAPPPRAAAPAALRGFACFSPRFQNMENAAARRAAGVPDGASGVLIAHVPLVSALSGVVLAGDALIAVDGEPISNDGRVRFGGRSPLDFRVRVSLKLVGEPLALTLLRGGARVDVATTAEAPPLLVPHRWHGRAAFFLFAGLVFSPMHFQDTKALPHAYEASLRLLGHDRKHEKRGQQVVALVALLPHSLTLGYKLSSFDREALLAVNGADIDCLADVFRACRDAQGEFCDFLFTGGRRVILPLADARRVTGEVMRSNKITHEASDDVLAAVAAHDAAAAAAGVVEGVVEGASEGASEGAAATAAKRPRLG